MSNAAANISIIDHEPDDKSAIAGLVAKHGSSSATAWLESERYQIWRPFHNIVQSSFPPVVGYMRRDPWVFAWGNPLVSDTSALEPTARAFITWVESHYLRLVWCCVDQDLARILESKFLWSTMNCIYEEIIVPARVIELTSEDAKGREVGSSNLRDLKRNLRRAEREMVKVSEIKWCDWTAEVKKEVSDGIAMWKKSRNGVQLASTTLQPWADFEHRRYWLARLNSNVIGILVITPTSPTHYIIVNAISFPNAPKGTSEKLIWVALKDLHDEETESSAITVSFGITASDSLNPSTNLKGWKVTSLSTIYGKIVRGAGLLQRGDFRKKFASEREPMYVGCPLDGFGIDGISALLKMLRC